jgi:predicted AlkP superfamily phosphohydrolase/phosphomutase
VKGENKILVIGLDGGTFDVLGPMMERGKMPTLAAMIERGSSGKLLSTIPPVTAPAWASLITGMNPGKHGVFNFGPVDRALYEERWTRIVNSNTFSGPALWDLIGKAGKKVGVINVPLTYPPHAINGFMVTGMLTPQGADNYTYPPDLASILGDYRIDISMDGGEYSDLHGLNTEDPEAMLGLLEELTAQAEVRTETTIRLMHEYAPDFMIVFFTETDRLQHVYWTYIQPEQKRIEDPAVRKLHEAVEGFFQNLDGNVAKLFEAVGEDAMKICMSDHGFGPATTKTVNLNVWLREKGLISYQKNLRSALNPRSWLKRIGMNKEALYRLLGPLLAGKTVRKLERSCARAVSRPIDWDSTKAVFIPMVDFFGGILINSPAVGERRGGNVDGSYETFRNGLIEQLRELTDPQTGRPIVSQVFKREELYRGPQADQAPDIIFVMDTDYCGSRSLLSKSVVSENAPGTSLWTGTHRREGIVIFDGPNISPGKISSRPEIQDLASTILYLLDIAIPADMDGKVIRDALEPSYLNEHEIRHTRQISGGESGDTSRTQELSVEEMEKIQKHLEDLGYLS